MHWPLKALKRLTLSNVPDPFLTPAPPFQLGLTTVWRALRPVRRPKTTLGFRSSHGYTLVWVVEISPDWVPRLRTGDTGQRQLGRDPSGSSIRKAKPWGQPKTWQSTGNGGGFLPAVERVEQPAAFQAAKTTTRYRIGPDWKAPPAIA